MANDTRPIRVKVCGMTQAEQVHQLDEMGVEFCGFIFYPRSPRYIHKHMSAADIKAVRGKINKVGVFVNTPAEEILKKVNDCGLYLVQLHGDETPRECEKISNYITVIKAFRLSELDNIQWKVREYYDVADMFMFDTEGSGYGGTGKKFDWNVLNELDIRKPFFLSGGIEPGDARKLREFSGKQVAKDLFAVDINSRFETTPGVKNMEKIRLFLQELRP